ncbi:TPA: CesT family type III secretion system chaperone [Salmonella enterica subsp. enterica serovar Saintpaul str. CFSAN004144]|nr:CesT family type III secretion system chaperone [Salmonella enterica subsp. enterica serovar Saintpaul str. CFSAN004144]
MNRDDIVISEVGDALGLPLHFDEEGVCGLQFDETLFLSLAVWGSGRWLLTGVLLENLPTQMGEEFWKRVLSYNEGLAREHAGSIVYSNESSSILLMDTITELSNAHAVVAHLEKFVNHQEFLMCELQRK